jgi:hypothetical protein
VNALLQIAEKRWQVNVAVLWGCILDGGNAQGAGGA